MAAQQSRWMSVRRSVESLLPQESAAAVDWEEALAGTADAIDRRAQLATLFKWTCEGQVVSLRQHIEREELPQLVLDMADDHGYGLLHYAVKYAHADCARVLLFAGATPDTHDREGLTPLIWAVKEENLAVMRLLLELHASLTPCDKEGRTALAWAVQTNQPAALELLLEARQVAMEEALQSDEDKEPLVAALRTALRNGFADCVCTIMRFLTELVLPGDLNEIIDDDDQRRSAMRALLTAYSQLPPEALARCVAHAFKAYPCSCLHGLIQLSAAARQHSGKLRTRDIVTSEALRSGADRLQLAVPASLGELNEQLEVNTLLRSSEGHAILPLAVRAECKLLLAQPTIQHFLNAEWLGPLLDAWLNKSGSSRLYCLRGLAVLCLLLPQILLLPVIALYPPLEAQLERLIWDDLCLKRIFEGALAFSSERGERPYLLGVPVVKFTVSQALDFFLTLVLTFSIITPSAHGAIGGGSMSTRTILIAKLGWVGASLLSEVRQIATGDSGGFLHELQALFSSATHSAYRSDMFNLLDVCGLITATAALITMLMDPSEGIGPSEGPTPSQTQAASSLLSVSLFLLWLRSLRALSLLPSIGPLVLMVAKMTKDVAKWALLLLMCVSTS